MELSELKYSAEHEWVAVDGDTVTVGITDYAPGRQRCFCRIRHWRGRID